MGNIPNSQEIDYVMIFKVGIYLEPKCLSFIFFLNFNAKKKDRESEN